MKVRTIELDDDEDPVSVTVTIGWQELALIMSVFGDVSQRAITDVLGPSWADVLDGLLNGGFVFDSFQTGGLTEVIPQHQNLALKLGEAQAALRAARSG